MPLAAVGRPDAAGIFGVEVRVVRGAVALARAAKTAGRQVTEGELGVLCKKVCNLPFILIRGKRAGRIDQYTARGQQGRRIFENFRAQLGAVGHKAVIVLSCGGGLLAEHPLARAGRIDEHPVKLAGHGGGQAGRVLVGNDGVRHAHPLQILAQNFRAGRDKFICQQQAPALQSRCQLACLAAGRGAEVGHPHTGLHIQQRRRGGRAGFLGVEHTCMVPGVAARAEVWCRRKGGGTEFRRFCNKIHMFGKPIRRAAQRVDRDTSGGLRRGVSVQLVKAVAQERTLPRGEILWKFHDRSPCIKKPWAGKLPLQSKNDCISFSYLRKENTTYGKESD